MYRYLILLLFVFNSVLHAQEFTDLYGDYLGQPLPGETPVVFARGLVSTHDLEHSAVMFSPDGNEAFWHVNRPPGANNDKWISFTYTMLRINNRWTQPELSLMKHPFYSVDGQRLYFLGEPKGPYYADKQGDGWGAWQKIDLADRFPEFKDMFYINSVSSNGTLYLSDSNGPILNTRLGVRFNTIQAAINLSQSGDEIVIEPGIHHENLAMNRKDIILRSIDPNDPIIVGSTIIQGDSDAPVLSLEYSTASSIITGLTLRMGSVGISAIDSDTTIRHCRIMNNQSHGVDMSRQSSLHLHHCLITGNRGHGIHMQPQNKISRRGGG